MRKEGIYENLPDLDETIVQLMIQTSLIEMSMATPSRPTTSEVTPGTETQDQKREDAEGQSKKAMELTKKWITEWISDLDLLHRMATPSTVAHIQTDIPAIETPTERETA
ncbi:hypothetical protein H5410_004983 [Solanum commersonii]|uniref:Polyprotein protein n=1 Tax=Solanum commersonii TaxID=4109 RepID=A0A9J6A5D2_SOLCO|nr:hypothetical protein H5410_004983 [Solanum commersonii]